MSKFQYVSFLWDILDKCGSYKNEIMNILRYVEVSLK